MPLKINFDIPTIKFQLGAADSGNILQFASRIIIYSDGTILLLSVC